MVFEKFNLNLKNAIISKSLVNICILNLLQQKKSSEDKFQKKYRYGTHDFRKMGPELTLGVTLIADNL